MPGESAAGSLYVAVGVRDPCRAEARRRIFRRSSELPLKPIGPRPDWAFRTERVGESSHGPGSISTRSPRQTAHVSSRVNSQSTPSQCSRDADVCRPRCGSATGPWTPRGAIHLQGSRRCGMGRNTKWVEGQPDESVELIARRRLTARLGRLWHFLEQAVAARRPAGRRRAPIARVHPTIGRGDANLRRLAAGASRSLDAQTAQADPQGGRRSARSGRAAGRAGPKSWPSCPPANRRFCWSK